MREWPAGSAQPDAGRPLHRLTLYIDPALPSRWRLCAIGGGRLELARRDGGKLSSFAEGAALQLCWLDAEDRVLREHPAVVLPSPDEAGRLLLSIPASDQQALAGLGLTVAGLVSAGPRAGPGGLRVAVADTLRSGLADAVRGMLANLRAQLDEGERLPPAELEAAGSRSASARLAELEASLAAMTAEHLVRGIENPVAAEAGRLPRADELRLVNDDEMEAWLLRSESQRRLERGCEQAWRKLQPLLDGVADREQGFDPATLAPAAVLDAVGLATRDLRLEHGLQQWLLREASNPSLLDLKPTYSRLQVELLRQGLRADPVRPGSPPAAPPAVGPADAGPTAGGSAVAVPVPPSTAASLPEQVAWMPAHPASGIVGAQASEAAMHLLGNLLALRPAVPGQDAANASSPVDDAALVDALRAVLLRGRAMPAADLGQAVLQRVANAGPGDAGLAPRQQQAIELVGRLREVLASDPLLPAPARAWSEQLAPAYLGSQLRHEGGSGVTALQQLLEQLEFAGHLVRERDDAQSATVRDEVTGLVRGLAALPSLDAGALDVANRRLEGLLSRMRRSSAAIERRVVDACEGQQRLEDARRAVREELKLLFSGRRLAEPLADLVDDPDFPALLVLRVLRHGVDGREWSEVREQLATLDRELLTRAFGDVAGPDAQAALDWLAALLRAEAGAQGRLAKHLESLAQALQHGGVALRACRSLAVEPQADDPKWQQDQLAAADPRLQSLAPGDWLDIELPPGSESRRLKLAWRAPGATRFVFVGALGNKAADLGAAELRTALRAGHAKPVDAVAGPVAERVWGRLLEGLHGDLAGQVMRDGLTGLPNRRELVQRLEAWLRARERPPLAVLWIGVDHLRALNQSRGLAAGDGLLCELAQELESTRLKAGPFGTLAARIASDEFAVLLTGCDAEQAAEQAESLRERLASPSAGRQRIQVSIGVATADASCSSVETLLAEAERACRAAKESGRHRVYLHRPGDQRLQQMRETADWVGRVDEALQQQRLVLYAQPALALSSRALRGPRYVELLLRLRGEGDAMVPPQQFIIAAERYGQIGEVDHHVIEKVAALLRRPRAVQLALAFNVSAFNLIDPGFVDAALGLLMQSEPRPGQLCLELTETAAIEHFVDARASMQRLRAAGVLLALDDFGAGWASHQYLRQLPCDIVKVDGSFIRGIVDSPEDRAVARSLNELAQMLGKFTIAEHVEDEATLAVVREIGFDYAQGWAVARPAPVDELFDALGAGPAQT